MLNKKILATGKKELFTLFLLCNEISYAISLKLACKRCIGWKG